MFNPQRFCCETLQVKGCFGCVLIIGGLEVKVHFELGGAGDLVEFFSSERFLVSHTLMRRSGNTPPLVR